MSDSLSENATGTVPGQPRLRRALFWMIAYALIVAVIVFWPEPFLSALDPWIRRVTAGFPGLTLVRVEFIANVAMFVPLGCFLAMFLRRHRYLVVPIGFLTTCLIETVQGLFLSDRSATVADVIANTAGACIGLLVIEVVDALRRRASRR
ncbi:VanZ family protein [Microbacterium sp. NPDC089698]|uniref:VanZ family protein n=1 Tax=unclassified Microbacterium TaxID=2609290 RepID=UPI00282BC8B0|nr:VanZ family protein [Microbacterium sp.]MDR2323523.1 VanZ family protein [Microbacterium sp.]